MWRRCDLHRHSEPDELGSFELDPSGWVQQCLDENLDLVAITDHDNIRNVQLVVEAGRAAGLPVIPGFEASTDRGHILVLAPESEDFEVLREFMTRVNIREHAQVSFDTLSDSYNGHRADGSLFSRELLLIAAHADMTGSLLAGGQAMSLELQITLAERLTALEVVDMATVTQWNNSGIKQSGHKMPIVRGSDSHGTGSHQPRSTWLYLPQVSAQALKHALATCESSVVYSAQKPNTTSTWIRSVAFSGGLFGEQRFDFVERTNAIIGPPSSGKSLIIDAIRWALGIPCTIPEVSRVSEARLSRSLPIGTEVTVEVEIDGGTQRISRRRGGTSPSDVVFRPVAFSQTELTRRAMEDTPSLALLDIHAEGADRLIAALRRLRADAKPKLRNLIAKADQAASLRAQVENPQDGLSAVTVELNELAGSEPSARRAAEVSRIEGWRMNVKSAIMTWAQATWIEEPSLPMAPQLVELKDNETLLPHSEVERIFEDSRSRLVGLVQETAAASVQALQDSDSQFEALSAELEQELTEIGFGSAGDFDERLGFLRSRMIDLENKQHQLLELVTEIRNAESELIDMVREAEHARSELIRLRKSTCRRVNESMHSVFASMQEASDFSEVEPVWNEARTGTYLRATSIGAIEANVDRERIIRLVTALRSGADITVGPSAKTTDQDTIVQEALARDKVDIVADLAFMFPADVLELQYRAASGAVQSFQDLTEGLRALAIKEISFALSPLPALSDQPEDAVPTTSVFEHIVPTLREQRASRQFILASHDANIVVAGDVERVIVLGSASDVGTLADDPIRQRAIDLLEGGQEAFQLRWQRYGKVE